MGPETARAMQKRNTPPGTDFFCAEPVSHCTDAVDLAADGLGDTGLRILAAGESLVATVHFLPQWDALP